MEQRPADPLTRVAVVGDAMVAQLKAAVLQSAGIEPHLRGEGFGPYPVTVGRLAEVEIWVRESDRADAEGLLDIGAAETPGHHPTTARGAGPAVPRALAAALGVILALAVILTAMRIF